MARVVNHGAAVLACALAGLAAGAAAELVAEVSPALDQVGSYSAVWVVTASLVGRLAPDRRAALVRPTAFLLAVVAGYYLAFSWSIGVLTRFALLWAFAAGAIGPVLGWLGWSSGAAGWRGLSATLGLAGLLGGEALLLLGWRAGPPWRPAVVVASAAALALVVLSRRPRLGLALLAPAAAVGLALHHLAGAVARLLV